MNVTIIGCGEAFDERYPNTSVLASGPLTVLFDCGYSVPPALWQAGIGPGDIDLIYISHAHADHYFGLPPLLGRMWEDGRVKPLTILSQPAVLEQIRDLLDYGYRTLQKRFGYAIEYRAAEPCEIAGVRFSFAPTNHSVTNLAVRAEAGGKSLFYSGDGMFTDASRALVTGADLAIHEAFQFEPSPVHTDIPSLLAMADDQQVKRLGMVHVQRAVRAGQKERIEAAAADSSIDAILPLPGQRFATL